MSTCSQLTFTMHLDRANIQELVIRDPDSQGGAAKTDLSYITRAIFTVGGYSVDSDTDATAIWWTDSETRTITIDGAEESFTGDVLKIQAGPEFSTAGLTAGEYSECCLTIYDTDHAEGAVYTDDIWVEVKSSC